MTTTTQASKCEWMYMSETLGSLGTEQSNKLLDLPAESDLPCFSAGFMPEFRVSSCRKGSVFSASLKALNFTVTVTL